MFLKPTRQLDVSDDLPLSLAHCCRMPFPLTAVTHLLLFELCGKSLINTETEPCA